MMQLGLIAPHLWGLSGNADVHVMPRVDRRGLFEIESNSSDYRFQKFRICWKLKLRILVNVGFKSDISSQKRIIVNSIEILYGA